MWKKIILGAALFAGGMVSGFAAYESDLNSTNDTNAQLCPIGENGRRGDCYAPRNNRESAYRDSRGGWQGSYCNGSCRR